MTTSLHARAAKVAERMAHSPYRSDLDLEITALIADLDAALTQCRQKALEDARRACLDEMVDYEDTKHPEDAAYNNACKDCAVRCRALAQTEAGEEVNKP